MSRDERAARAHFEERYGIEGNRAAALVEERVIGAVWGANGYTTLAQADELLDHLALTPTSRLLDVGTGRGWPALYLAQRTGCSVVGTDLPLSALQKARARADREQVGDRAAMVVASGGTLPFRRRSFDAIVHTDVLCWLTAKLAVLRALGVLLRPGGRMAFLTIHVASGLSPADRSRARADGPRAVDTRGSHAAMLNRAGFDVVVERDVTAAFLETARAWLRESVAFTDELAALEPAGGFDERQEDRRRMIAAIEDGLLVRTLFVATRRGSGLSG